MCECAFVCVFSDMASLLAQATVCCSMLQHVAACCSMLQCSDLALPSKGVSVVYRRRFSHPVGVT